MRTNGKSCYHRYVIEKEEHAYLWENEYISRRAITQARVFLSQNKRNRLVFTSFFRCCVALSRSLAVLSEFYVTAIT